MKKFILLLNLTCFLLGGSAKQVYCSSLPQCFVDDSTFTNLPSRDSTKMDSTIEKPYMPPVFSPSRAYFTSGFGPSSMDGTTSEGLLMFSLHDSTTIASIMYGGFRQRFENTWRVNSTNTLSVMTGRIYTKPHGGLFLQVGLGMSWYDNYNLDGNISRTGTVPHAIVQAGADLRLWILSYGIAGYIIHSQNQTFAGLLITSSLGWVKGY